MNNATLYQVNEETIVVIETGVLYTRLSNGQVWMKNNRPTNEIWGEPITYPDDSGNLWEFLKQRCVNGIPF